MAILVIQCYSVKFVTNEQKFGKLGQL
jgi:hypothetical protein